MAALLVSDTERRQSVLEAVDVDRSIELVQVEAAGALVKLAGTQGGVKQQVRVAHRRIGRG